MTRSGIFCAVANAIECMKVEKMVDIFQVVKMMRSQRPGAVPTVVSAGLGGGAVIWGGAHCGECWARGCNLGHIPLTVS